MPEIPYTGQVTIEVRTPLPTRPGFLVGIDAVYAPDGWVASDFIIRWGNNSYSPEAQPFMTSKHEAFVLNDNPSLQLRQAGHHGRLLRHGQVQAQASRHYVSTATLTRRTENTAWLSHLSFNLASGLAPVVTGGDSLNNMNQISFSEYSVSE